MRDSGAVMLIALVTTYVLNGLVGILIGHDLLDAVLMAFLAVGIYLTAGTSMLQNDVTYVWRFGRRFGVQR